MPDSAQMGAYSLKWIGVELIMSDERILNQMSSLEKVDFLKRLHLQLLVKQRYRDVFGGISDAVTAYIFYKVMHSLGVGTLESHFEVGSTKVFQDRLIARDPHLIELLLNKFVEYVKNH